MSCSDNENALSDGEGFLNIDLSIDKQDEITTRSTGSVVDLLIVEITNSEGQEVKKFNSYMELKESGTLRLSEGEYTVNVYPAEEMDDISDSPYYSGIETFQIQPNLFTEAKVVCSMQNAKIRLVLSEELVSNIMPDYKITLSVVNGDKNYDSSFFDIDGISEDLYFSPSETVLLSMEGTTITGDRFEVQESVDGGVNANDFLTIYIGLKSKSTRGLNTDNEFDITLITTIQ